ncbi:hypothetical protein EN46_07470 [Citrobacter amalonaticus]
MLRIIKSIQLKEVTPIINRLSFDKKRILSPDDITALFDFRTTITESEPESLCMLNIHSDVKAVQPAGEDVFTLSLAVEYCFDLLDPDAFHSCNKEERVRLAVNYVYMDFRNKLTTLIESAGVKDFHLPYTIDQLVTTQPQNE